MGKQPSSSKYPSPLSVRIDDDLREALEKIAEEEDRPVGNVARILLKEALRARAGEDGEGLTSKGSSTTKPGKKTR